MIGDASLHVGGHAKGLVNPAEVVVHEVERHSRFEILDLEKTLVSRVNLRIDMRIVRFWRSTQLVEMCSGAGSPEMISDLMPVQTGGLQRLADPKRLGAQLGFTLVLHTWTRQLLLHPHLHGGGKYILAARMRAGEEVTREVLTRPGRYQRVAENLEVKEVVVGDGERDVRLS